MVPDAAFLQVSGGTGTPGSMLDSGPAVVPVTAKLPPAVVEELDRMATERGITRSALIRRIADAAVEGTLKLPSEDDLNAALQTQRLRANLRRHVAFMAATSPDGEPGS